jgi:short-subunit dehydrogenase
MVTGTTLIVGVSADLMEVAQILGGQGERIGLMSRTEPRLREFQTRLKAQRIDCEIFATDVTEPTAVLKAFKALAAWSQELDRFIYNVGMASAESATELTESEFHRVMSTNFLGFVNCFQFVLPMFNRTGGGHAIAISDRGIAQSEQSGVAHATSTASLQIYLAALRNELRDEGITVSELVMGQFAEHGQPRYPSNSERVAGLIHVLETLDLHHEVGN